MEHLMVLNLPPVGNRISAGRNSQISSTSSGVICRICHDGDRAEKLISPCKCNGSVAVVHLSCLEQWLNTSNTDHCDICKFKFKVYKDHPPFSEWLKSEESWGSGGSRVSGVYGDLFCLLLLTPLCLASVYMCLVGAVTYKQHGIWEGAGLIILSVFVLFTYLLWASVTIRFQVNRYRSWCNTNQLIRLRDPSSGGDSCGAAASSNSSAADRPTSTSDPFTINL